jgi:hypothetical protein
MVSLESTFRNNIELNTTYLIGKTIEGQVVLLPKQLIEQANVVTEDSSDDDDDINPSKKKGTFKTTKTAYTSQGNVVTCITGSFD